MTIILPVQGVVTCWWFDLSNGFFCCQEQNDLNLLHGAGSGKMNSAGMAWCINNMQVKKQNKESTFCCSPLCPAGTSDSRFCQAWGWRDAGMGNNDHAHLYFVLWLWKVEEIESVSSSPRTARVLRTGRQTWMAVLSECRQNSSRSGQIMMAWGYPQAAAAN